MTQYSETSDPTKQGAFSPTTLDLAMHDPVVYSKVIKQFGTQGRGDNLARDLMLMNSTLGIESEFYSVFKEGWYWENIKIGTGAVAGSTQTLTLDSDSLVDGTSFVKAGHIISYPSSTIITGLVNNVNYSNGEISVIAGSGVTLPAVSDGDILMISNSAFGEASKQPKGTTKKYDKDMFNLQLLKDTDSLSGSLATDGTWVDVSEWGSGFDWYNVKVADMEARMDLATSNALMWNTGAIYTADATSVTNNLAEAVGDVIRETKGLVKHAQEKGLELPTDAGVADYSDFDSMDEYLRGQGDVSQYIIGRLGNQLSKAYSRSLFDNIVDGNGSDVTANMLMSQGLDEADANARAVELNYKQYCDGSRTWLWKTSNEFSHPKTNGTEGYGRPQNGIWYPSKTITDGSATMANITMLYKQKGAYNRMREIWMQTGAGGNSSTYNIEQDVIKTHIRSHIGLAVGAPNLLIYSNSEA